MLVLLLPIAWFLIFINLSAFNKRKQFKHNFGELILITAIIWMLILVFMTEFLSLFHGLNQFWVASSWAGISILLAISFLRGNYRLDPRLHGDDIFRKIKDLPQFYKFLVINLTIILVWTFVFGIIFPPNNPDAMSYHLARVMHWIQNGSVALYPSHIIRQNIYLPGAEYIATHVLLLANNDLFLNLIQWFSMVGSLLVVFLITKLFDQDIKTQILTVVFAVTLPIGLLQSNSIQNDYVATFWLVTFVYFFIRAIQKKEDISIYIGALALGLGLLTKATNYFYGTAFLLVFFWLLRKNNIKKTVVNISTTLVIILFINSGFYLRNQFLFGSPLGDFSTISIAGTTFSIGTTIRHLTYDFIYQLLTPINSINYLIKSIYIIISSLLSFDKFHVEQSEINFLKSTSPGSEDATANSIHFIIVFASFIYLFFQSKKKYFLKTYWFAIAISIVLLDIFVVWTQFNTRYFISFYILQAPIVAIFLRKFEDKTSVRIFLITLFVISFAYIIFNPGKPIKSLFSNRNDHYFNLYFDPVYQQSNKMTADIMAKKHYKNIGLNFDEFYFEYPLWVYLKDRGVSDFRIEHIDARNKTAQTKTKEFKPDVIIMCDYCFIDAPKYHAIYSKWAKVKIKVPYFVIYGR